MSATTRAAPRGVAEIKAVFDKFDADSSGTISKRELIKALKAAGLTDTKSALDLFKGFDVNDDGELTFDEVPPQSERASGRLGDGGGWSCLRLLTAARSASVLCGSFSRSRSRC